MNQLLHQPDRLYRTLQLFLVLSVSIFGILYGYNIGSMSGILPLMQARLHLTSFSASLFVSSFLWGIVFVAFFMARLSDYVGRKTLLVLSALTSMVGILVMLNGDNILVLSIGRLLMGVASGMASITVPLYLTESMPAHLRGRGVVSFQVCLTFGILLSTVICRFVYKDFSWRPILWIEFIPAVILLSLSLVVPESPRWLISQGRNVEALQVIQKTRSELEAKKVFSEILENKKTAGRKIFEWNIFLKKRFLFPILLVMCLGSFNQLTGINIILQYDSTILFFSGFKAHDLALSGSIIITALNLVMTIVSFCLVDHIERRKLLAFGLAGIVICLLGIAAAHGFMEATRTRAIIVTSCLLGFIVFFAIAPGALIWPLMGELLPSKIRSTGLSLAALTSSVMGALLSASFLPLQNIIGLGGLFLFCAFISLLYLFLTYFLPTVNRRSLEEIEKNMVHKNDNK